MMGNRVAASAVGMLVMMCAVLAGCVPVSARLTDSPPMTGVLLDADTGAGVARATVVALPRDVPPGPETVSDSAGRFALPERDRRHLFLAMPGAALDAVPVHARLHAGDGSSERYGYGVARKWLRQRSPAPAVTVPIVMLPYTGPVVLSDTCRLDGVEGYVARLLEALPALREQAWFHDRFVDQPDVGRDWYDGIARLMDQARRACADRKAFASLEAALEDFAGDLFRVGD